MADTPERPATGRTRYGPWALITGGSEGVGAEVAAQLATSGINLILVARKPEPLAETAQRCRAAGVEVITLALDLTAVDAADQIAAATEGLEVGLLVHNAGANTCNDEFLDAESNSIDTSLDLNIAVMLALVRQFGRPMRQRRRGGILLVGSMSGYLGARRHAIYGAVKAFSRIFAESLWLELREHDVDVLHLVLGLTRTPAMQRAGINFDTPGLTVSDPADVAREGLRQLPHGPVHIVGGNAGALAHSTRPDRAAVLLETQEMMQQLLGPQSK
ncbi:short-chain dehydrogenase [Mycolicibacterium peregrinum]|uniref:Short-chain dehydrogenase n=1 Tax=Mycolicibacterium peregrinum TaxID=43304 RepID=A0A1A0QNH0_MYCPR|nr:SDR family NAD(P)-dependent oxidoreductase [Mycolicibacterium peregrinum]OBB23059.1 short-chain dehydrogenase [Mycolicibacterium peregrinum]